MKRWKRNLAGWIVTAAVGMADAHLGTAGFKPEGGETLNPGNSFTITWEESVHHQGGTNIDFSKDGKTWTTIKAGFAGVSGANSFKWTVPDEVTTTGRIRICQLAGAVCTDANNTSMPGGSAPYVLVSKNFTIAAPTAISEKAGKGRGGLEMAFNGSTQSLEVAFGLQSAERVLIRAYDAKGEVVADLYEGEAGPGFHDMTIPAKSLASSKGILVFRFKAGDQVRTLTWNPAP